MGQCSGTQKIKKEQQQTKKDEQPLIYRRIRCPNHLGKILVLGSRIQKQECSKCKTKTRVFGCQNCKYNICLKCYNIPKEYFRFYCIGGHEQQCYCNSRLIFQGNLGNHICDVCKSNVDAAYSCRQCERDLCMKCKKESIDQFASVSQTCINQHQKRKLIYEDSLTRCSQCNEFYYGFWRCKGCTFKRCLNCKFEIEEKS